jgi:hypothetical protein
MATIALLCTLLLAAEPPPAETAKPTPASELTVDESFDPPIPAPAYRKGQGPLILVDQQHRNVVSLTSYFGPVGRFLTRDGYTVRPLSEPFSATSLKNARIVVIINAQSPEGLPEGTSAFGEQEIRSLEEWVRRGGGLLFIADRAPFGGPASALGKALGVTFDNNTVLRHGPDGKPDGVLKLEVKTSGKPTHPLFSEVSQLVYVVGESLRGPAPILTAPKNTYSGATMNTGDGPDASGRPLALAFSRGSGRVVVIGDAGIFSAFGSANGPTHRGISEADNARFLRNVVRWLAP